MKKIFILICLSFASVSFAQQRIEIGAGFGVGTGLIRFYDVEGVKVTPSAMVSVGYRFDQSQKWLAGLQIAASSLTHKSSRHPEDYLYPFSTDVMKYGKYQTYILNASLFVNRSLKIATRHSFDIGLRIGAIMPSGSTFTNFNLFQDAYTDKIDVSLYNFGITTGINLKYNYNISKNTALFALASPEVFILKTKERYNLENTTGFYCPLYVGFSYGF